MLARRSSAGDDRGRADGAEHSQRRRQWTSCSHGPVLPIMRVRAKRRLLAVVAVAVALPAFASCGGEPESREGSRDPGAEPAPSPVLETGHRIPCDVGGRPDYHVPGADAKPNPVLGCARLGAGDLTVEFSVHRERIGGDAYVCVNPAYPAAGKRAGEFVPSACLRPPIGDELDVVDFKPPTQGEERYERVIWGTVGPGRRVTAEASRQRVSAVTIPLTSRLAYVARTPPGGRSFDLFVVELPNATACGPASVSAPGGDRVPIPPRPSVCRKAGS